MKFNREMIAALLLMVYPAWGAVTTSKQIDKINASGGSTLSVPTVGANLATDTNTLTLTNKTVSGASNTITNVSLTAGVTGTLPVGNGGLGVANPTSGSVLVGAGSSAVNPIAAGTANQVFGIQGSNTTPNYRAIMEAPAKNYIRGNPDAEIDTTGWATYNDGASNIPVDCTGGTATSLTFSRSTSSPLHDSASFSMVQANSTSIQGKGISYAFTIDSADQAKVFSVQYDYNASSTFVASDGKTAPLNDGTTTTNAGNSDVETFVYDVTNAVLIPVTPQTIIGNGSTNFTFTGRFQTAANSTSYRLCQHVATASANATGWTFKTDNYSVTPYVGSSLGGDVIMSANKSGGALTANTTIPSWTSLKDNTNSFNASTGVFTVPLAGDYMVNFMTQLTTNNNANPQIRKNGTVVIWGSSVTATAGNGTAHGTLVNCLPGDTITTTLDASFTLASTATLNTWSIFKVNTSPASSLDGRVVGAIVTHVANVTATAGTFFIFPTVLYDSNSAYNASTGVYTVPEAGVWDVSLSGVQTTAAAPSIWLAKNGVANTSGAYSKIFDASTATRSGAVSVYALAGDTFTIVPDTNTTLNFTTLSGIATGNRTIVTFAKRSGSSPSNASGSVTTSSLTNAYHTEFAVVSASCTADPCTIASGSPGISAINRTGTGSYTAHFPTGTFSAVPACYGAGYGTSTGAELIAGNNLLTTTAWNFENSGSASARDGGFMIQCFGPR